MQKQLLLPGAKTAILLEPPHRAARFGHWLAVTVGVATVVVGAADIGNRLTTDWLPPSAAFSAFAPAVLLDPAIQQVVLEPVATSTPQTLKPFIPTRLVIPSIDVDAEVEPVGKNAVGAMATPKALQHAGWYKLGSKPGGEGNAVFAGHINNALGLPGVFKELSQVKEGDMVKVFGSDGTEGTYVVEGRTIYKDTEAPLEEIFANTGPSRVVLITCEGEWDEVTHTFDHRLVVVARPV